MEYGLAFYLGPRVEAAIAAVVAMESDHLAVLAAGLDVERASTLAAGYGRLHCGHTVLYVLRIPLL